MRQVRQGAYLLDERYPGWEHKISLDTLSARNDWNCILGQLYGTYEKGKEKLELVNADCRRMGFQPWPRFGEYHSSADSYRLDAAWTRLIKDRLENRIRT